jgi:hypothetical protein
MSARFQGLRYQWADTCRKFDSLLYFNKKQDVPRIFSLSPGIVPTRGSVSPRISPIAALSVSDSAAAREKEERSRL